MKRFLIVIGMLICIALLCSCGTAKQDKLYLEQAEYGAYQADEFVTSCAELGRLGTRCEFSWFSSLFDIPIENLNTKRGVRVGSTLEDIAEAYEGIHFSCTTSEIYDAPIADLIKSIDTSEEQFEVMTWSYFETREYMQGLGVPVSSEKDQSDLQASGERLMATLTFKIDEGVVTDIILWAKDNK